MFILFMPTGHTAMAWDLGNQAEIKIELCKHRAHVSLLLAEISRAGVTVQRPLFNIAISLHDHPYGKVHV